MSAVIVLGYVALVLTLGWAGLLAGAAHLLVLALAVPIRKRRT